jgi:hypothetical protein
MGPFWRQLEHVRHSTEFWKRTGLHLTGGDVGCAVSKNVILRSIAIFVVAGRCISQAPSRRNGAMHSRVGRMLWA